MTDRTNQQLKIYQGDKVIATGDSGKTSVHADLPEGDYPAGTFKESFYNTVTKTESDKVDVPSVLALHLPGTPKASLKAGDGKVTVTFAKINGVTGYEIWSKKTTDNWPAAPFKAVDANTLSVDVAGLTNGTEYTIAVVAVNDYGKSDIGGTGASDHATPTVPTVPVTSVAIDPTSASVGVGKTVTLSAIVKPDNATEKGVNWSIVDNNIAAVSGGVVTGKAAGKTKLTATSKADGKITGAADITVS